MTVRSWDEYERRLLLGGSWLPVTGAVLFVQATPERSARTLVTGVRGRHVLEYYGHPFRERVVEGPSLVALLEHLLPLQTPEHRRDLIVRTANPEWSAVFAATRRMRYPHSEMAWFSVAGIASVLISDKPNSWNPDAQRGWSGARKLEMLQVLPNGEDVGHSLRVRVNDSNRWELVQPTKPFPVPVVWDPDARRVPDKFTHEHLAASAAAFGLRPFDEDFYAPDGRGIIVERTDPMKPGTPTYTLAQARGEEPSD